MIVIKHKGSFKNTEKFLDRAAKTRYLDILDRYGKEGVDALASATPVDSGETAQSWGYKISRNSTGYTLEFTNSHVVSGVPIAIILQYGHGTRNGGYVEGRDYINPAIQPVFDRLARESWREVTRS